MRILVTGSSGMIGTALTEALKKEGHKVVGLDIKPAQIDRGFTTVRHDLRKPISERARKLLGTKPFDLIIHLAANARVYQLVLDPDRALDNILMTHNIFEYARAQKTPRLIFASSRETYGNGKKLPVHESVASQRNAESSYTASKICGEAYCYSYMHCYGIDARIVRFSNVYGRFDNSDRFIPKAISFLLKGKPFTVYGKNKTLDFTYLDDAVSGVLALIKRWNRGAEKHREYNIASGEQSTLFKVACELRDLLDSPSEILVGENLTGEVMNYQADISRMSKLGWKPRTDLRRGLKKAVGYYQSVLEPSRTTKKRVGEVMKNK